MKNIKNTKNIKRICLAVLVAILLLALSAPVLAQNADVPGFRVELLFWQIAYVTCKEGYTQAVHTVQNAVIVYCTMK